MGTFIKNIAEIPYIQELTDNRGEHFTPGLGVIKQGKGKSKFLGVDGVEGPWFYLLEHPAGTQIPLHKHDANRIEYILEGMIEFREFGCDRKVYGANTYSYVAAGTMYEYRVLESTKILLFFDSRPGIIY